MAKKIISIDVQKNNFLIKPARFWKPGRFCEVIYVKNYIDVQKNNFTKGRGKVNAIKVEVSVKPPVSAPAANKKTVLLVRR